MYTFPTFEYPDTLTAEPQAALLEIRVFDGPDLDPTAILEALLDTTSYSMPSGTLTGLPEGGMHILLRSKPEWPRTTPDSRTGIICK